MITPETIEKIMDAARIEDVVGEFVSLKKRGINMIGLCPFHNEKTPSFNVSPSKGIFKCFGCGKGGNAVNFLMEHEHYTYPEALRYLAGKYSIEIEEEKPDPAQQEAQDEKESLFNLTAFAQNYFTEQLHETEEGRSIALTYLEERGFSKEMIKKFGIGYCPDKWDAFTRMALKQGYKKDYLLKTSLSKAKDQMLYDSFRGRITFPIHNLSGRVLGFGARIMTSDKKRPKYINSAESDIYHKSKALYGIFFAKSPMASQDNCYLVEGYTDVISLHQAGIHNVIATSGTSLTTDQIKLIRRYTNNVTLLFDGDPAGIKAAFRGIDMILEEGLNVRLVMFPEEQDPDSFARNNRPAEVQEFIEKQTVDFLTFKTKLLLDETQHDPIKKAGLIKEIAQTIALIPEPITRTLYIKKCSDLMEIEEKLLVSEVNKIRRKNLHQKQQKADREEQNREPAVTEPVTTTSQIHEDQSHGKEKELIRLLLNYAENDIHFEVENDDNHLEKVDVKLVDLVVQDLRTDDLSFEDPVCQSIFDTFARHWLNHQDIPGHHVFTDHENQETRQLAIDLMTNPHNLSPNWEHRHRIYVIEEQEQLKSIVLKAIYNFKLKKLEKMIRENQHQLKEAEQNGNQDTEHIIELMRSQRDLDHKRREFAAALNRVVTK